MNRTNNGKGTRRQRGVSLIEFVMATAVASVQTTAAVPSMSNARTQHQLRASSSEMFAGFNLARAEAIRRGAAVAVIPADTQDWSTGWKVFVDENDNGAQDSGEPTLVARPAAGGVAVRPYFGATYSGRVLSYTAEGRLHRPGGQGLVIGRLVLTRDGLSRSLCFARRARRRRGHLRLAPPQRACASESLIAVAA